MTEDQAFALEASARLEELLADEQRLRPFGRDPEVAMELATIASQIRHARQELSVNTPVKGEPWKSMSVTSTQRERTVMVGTRISPRHRDQLEVLAKRNGTTISRTVAEIVARALTEAQV